MTKRLILARHGNTFKPDDKPVWVGARSDLPLVEKGVAQAHALADALHNTRILPGVIVTGPLKRTREMASIVAEKLHIAPDKVCIDPRLREIDYGLWEGKSSDEIMTTGGSAELAAWNRHSIFPASPGWQPSEAQLMIDSAAMLAEAASGTSLIVTSNGILRFFARAALNAGDFPDRKVGTGNICVMDYDGKNWRISGWNQPPHAFLS